MAKQLTAAERAAKIEEMNRLFESMTPEERRVAIAKDVLAGIEKHELIPARGKYFCSNDNIFVAENMECQFSEVLEEVPYCSVCGIGSLLVCAVKRFNAVKVSEVVRSNTCIGDEITIDDHDLFVETLTRYFSQDQLILIEAAFESKRTGLSDCYDTPDFFVMEKAISKYRDSEDSFIRKPADQTLIGIMNNIIENNGTFVP